MLRDKKDVWAYRCIPTGLCIIFKKNNNDGEVIIFRFVMIQKENYEQK